MASKGMKVTGWIVGLLVFFLAVIFALSASEQSKHPGMTEAYDRCEQAVRLTAKNPTTAKIPNVRIDGRYRSYGYDFEWPIGTGLQMQNGFGAMIDTQATCGYNTATKSVVYLVIDDKTVFDVRTNAASDRASVPQASAAGVPTGS